MPDKPRDSRYETLDAWRGLACLMVVVGHAIGELTPQDWDAAGTSAPMRLLRSAIGQLYLGVPMFFVISGYCISASADSSLRRAKGAGQFFIRRFRRIYPPYWIFLGILALLQFIAYMGGWLPILTEGDCRIPFVGALSWQQWMGSLTLTESWRWHLLSDGPRSYFGPSWTLCYEEQFYALCGMLLFVCPKHFWKGVVAISCVTAATFAWSIHADRLEILEGFFFNGRWLVFAAGILVYHHSVHAGAKTRRGLEFLLGLALIAALAVRFAWMAQATRDHKTLSFELVTGCLFAAILLLLKPRDASMSRWASLEPLRFCGRICYSLYLMHWPVTIIVSHLAIREGVTGLWPTLLGVAPVAAGLSVIFAWAFHVLVERRFLNPALRSPLAPREACANPLKTS